GRDTCAGKAAARPVPAFPPKSLPWSSQSESRGKWFPQHGGDERRPAAIVPRPSLPCKVPIGALASRSVPSGSQLIAPREGLLAPHRVALSKVFPGSAADRALSPRDQVARGRPPTRSLPGPQGRKGLHFPSLPSAKPLRSGRVHTLPQNPTFRKAADP